MNTGNIQPLNVPVNQIGSGAQLVGTLAEEYGCLIEDVWYVPLGPVTSGIFLHFYWEDEVTSTISPLAQVPLTPISSPPFGRVELASLVLPEVLSPTQTGLAGKKRALRLGPGQSLYVAHSADFTPGVVVYVQGGKY